MDDYISRADAIEAVQTYLNILINSRRHGDDFTFINVLTEIRNKISALPSADAVDVNEVTIHYKPYPSADAVHKPDYSYEADMVRRLKEALSDDATVGDYPNDLISRNALMEYCSNQKSKTIDNNDIARFPSAFDESLQKI